MTKNKTIAIADVKTAAIVELYNALAERPVKKFADRATAEARLTAALAAAGMILVEGEDGSPDVAAAPAQKKAKAPAAERSGRRGPPPAFPDSGKIKVLVAENPKKKGTLTHARFEFYKTAKTVGEFMALGGRREDVIWDAKKGFVEVRAS